MIKGLLRLCGFLLVAAGFVVIVIDGTSSIAANALRYTMLRDTALQVQPASLGNLEARLRAIDPRLWEPVASTMLKAPTSLTLIVLGIVFLLLGRKRREQIGYPSRL